MNNFPEIDVVHIWTPANITESITLFDGAEWWLVFSAQPSTG